LVWQVQSEPDDYKASDVRVEIENSPRGFDRQEVAIFSEPTKTIVFVTHCSSSTWRNTVKARTCMQKAVAWCTAWRACHQ